MQIPGPVNIANNLTTTSSGYGLDARQGKILMDYIKEMIALPGTRHYVHFNGGAVFTTGRKEIYFTIAIKPLIDVTSITIDTPIITIRQNDKYIIEENATSGYVAKAEIVSQNTVSIQIIFNNTLPGINNDAAAVAFRGYLNMK